MNKTIIGMSFLIIATILYATRFICGAMGAITATQWSKEEFANYISYVPDGLMVVTIIALILGIIFFLWGFISKNKNY